MATTALIVEIVVIGAFALIWVSLFLFKILGLDIQTVSHWLSLYKDWSTGIILMAIAISYQLGWSIHQLSYFVSKNIFDRATRVRIFKNDYKNYDSIKATVFIKGSTFILDNIREQLSVVRLTRSAYVNFLLISIGLFILGNGTLGFAMLVITALLVIQANAVYDQYCNHIYQAYKVIRHDDRRMEKGQRKKPSKTGSP